MGVTQVLAKLAAQRAHVLLVEALGGWRARVAAEQAAVELGWRISLSPADADVLVVCGTAGPELTASVERIWEQLPGPRVRILVGSAAEALPSFEQARRSLSAVDVHVDDARTRLRVASLSSATETRGNSSEGASGTNHSGMDHSQPYHSAMDHSKPDHSGTDHSGMDHSGTDHTGTDHSKMDHTGTDHSQMDHTGTDHSQMDHTGTDHSGTDHSGTDHSGTDHSGTDHSGTDHSGMDHSGMDMAPAGIPLAGGAADRDGLEMDTLAVQLGPVLPYWPPGLVLHCALNGDVITRARARGLDDAWHGFVEPGGREAAARRCDDAAALLALAGASGLAADARRLRGALLRGDTAAAQHGLDRLERRVRRSLLRWSLGRLGVVEDPALAQHLVAAQAGSVFDRLLAMLGAARDANDGSSGERRDASRLIADLPQLVTGLDLAAARLVVASLGLSSLAAERGGHHE
ncbi:hypothetical protein ACIQC8_02295 [Agrococcus sediminis]